MLNLSLTKFATSGTILLITVFSLFITSSSPPTPVVTTIIDFESLSSNGEIVRNQFASSGVIFQPILGVDYVQGIPIPNFTHSGAKGIELCYGQEFCTSKLDVSFNPLQRRVKLWVGFTGRLESVEPIVLRALDVNNNEIAQAVVSIGPSNGPIPISTPLEVKVPTPTIYRVTAAFLRAETPSPTMFNNGLAFDDIEFDDLGTAPQCPATQPPAFTVNEPTDGKIVLQNAFTLDANLTTPDPFATLQINATGPSGTTRTFGPVFAASGHIQIFNISSLLFDGLNSLVFIVKDCAGTTQVTRTVEFRRITNTTIRVIDENNVRVQTARVYANSEFIGLTDANGILTVTPPLTEGTKLVARKLVAESSTYRDNHSQGSHQDWKFRVYSASMAVNDDGALVMQPVNYGNDPSVPQVLRVMRSNAMIGMHLVASVQWDASAAELEAVKTKLIGASDILYNATDGQIFIEQVEVADNARYWDDADFRVYTNQSFLDNVDKVGGLFDKDHFWSNGWVHMRINAASVTYAHELGHYAMALRDEYDRGDPSKFCTQLLIDNPPGGPFSQYMPRAACIMHQDSVAKKFCSNRPENPHKKGTRQGDSSCWTTLAARFRDTAGTPRWIMQSPETRGAIPGAINGAKVPLNDMPTKIMFENTNRANLCLPITVKAEHADGTPHVGRSIWVKTTYGQTLDQGKTDKNGILTVTGVHVGDSVSGTIVQFINCTTTAQLTPQRNQERPPVSIVTASLSQDVEQGRQQLKVGPTPFNVITGLKPTGLGAEVSIAVTDSNRKTVSLAKPPVVQFRWEGVEAQLVRVRYQPKTRRYVGTIANLPIEVKLDVSVEATDHSRQTVQSFNSFQISRPEAMVETDLLSADGQLTFTVPAYAMSDKARVSIGPPSMPLPDLPKGYEFASGPFEISSYPGIQRYKTGRVTFQLPRTAQTSTFANFAEGSMKIFVFDGKGWEDLGAVVHPPPIEIVSAETSGFGVFALAGRSDGKNRQQRALSTQMLQSGPGDLKGFLKTLFY